MALRLTYKFALPVGQAGIAAVHTMGVLRYFLGEGDTTEFYIGITNSVGVRYKQQATEHPTMTLMCVLSEGHISATEENYHNLEKTLIARLGSGFGEVGNKLICRNAQAGTAKKTSLYLLVNKKKLGDIPAHSPGHDYSHNTSTGYMSDREAEHYRRGVFIRPS